MVVPVQESLASLRSEARNELFSVMGCRRIVSGRYKALNVAVRVNNLSVLIYGNVGSFERQRFVTNHTTDNLTHRRTVFE
jgi:hypothetical protein